MRHERCPTGSAGGNWETNGRARTVAVRCGRHEGGGKELGRGGGGGRRKRIDDDDDDVIEGKEKEKEKEKKKEDDKEKAC